MLEPEQKWRLLRCSCRLPSLSLSGAMPACHAERCQKEVCGPHSHYRKWTDANDLVDTPIKLVLAVGLTAPVTTWACESLSMPRLISAYVIVAALPQQAKNSMTWCDVCKDSCGKSRSGKMPKICSCTNEHTSKQKVPQSMGATTYLGNHRKAFIACEKNKLTTSAHPARRTCVLDQAPRPTVDSKLLDLRLWGPVSAEVGRTSSPGRKQHQKTHTTEPAG